MRKSFYNFVRLSAFIFPLIFIVSCSKSDDTSPAPTSLFSYTSVRNFPITISFTNTSSNIGSPGYNYTWNFGDGAPASTLANPTHIYSVGGIYNITLTEDSPSGSGTTAQTIDLTGTTASGTSGRPGTVNFTFNYTPSFTVTFTDQSQNATSKHWTFGDATEATDPGTSFTHIFSGNGPFVVQLTATGDGGSAQSSATISF